MIDVNYCSRAADDVVDAPSVAAAAAENNVALRNRSKLILTSFSLT